MKINIFLFVLLSCNCFLFSQNTPNEKILDTINKISNDKEIIETNANSKIHELEIIEYKDIETPAISLNCKSEWDVQKQKECTSKFITMHVNRNFNTNLLSEVGFKKKIKIMIEFVIDTNGKPININATGGPEIMNQNAIEVIGTLPNLKPGTLNGKPVNVLYRMPITFKIQ